MYDFDRFEETVQILAEGLGGQFAEVAALANQAVARRCAERGLNLRQLPTGEATLILRASWIEATEEYFSAQEREWRLQAINLLFDMMAIDGGGTVPASSAAQ
jgi:hypothetical protein